MSDDRPDFDASDAEFPTSTLSDLIGVVTYDESQWVDCETCGGAEGYADDNDEWRDCPECDGAGGYNPSAAAFWRRPH